MGSKHGVNIPVYNRTLEDSRTVLVVIVVDVVHGNIVVFVGRSVVSVNVAIG